MRTIAIEGQARTELGKKASKDLRKEGKVPCVLYGGNEVVHFTAPTADFRNLVYSPEFKIVEITVDGKTYRCIMKELQFHPVTEQLLHLDFVQLVEGRKLTTEVPVTLVGSAPGVKVGGKLLQLIRKLTIKAKPEDLVDELQINVENLDLGKSVRVRDIVAIDGIQIMNPPNIPVATIEIPRALRSQQSQQAKDSKKK